MKWNVNLNRCASRITRASAIRARYNKQWTSLAGGGQLKLFTIEES